MDCYITRTGSFLPGEAIDNSRLPDYMGKLEGESDIREKILRMNGIKSRHYALDEDQNATHDVYGMAALAVEDCIGGWDPDDPIAYLSAGSTNTPLIGPGLSSILHGKLAEMGIVNHSLEINSNSGICTSATQALVNAYRAVKSGDHPIALSVGVEHPSEILKSTTIQPPQDRDDFPDDIKKSQWFMSVFLRFMLSDGAGAFVLQDRPAAPLSLRVDWTFSRSFANEAPLCMKLDNKNLLLSQDVDILSRYMKPCVQQTVDGAMRTNGERLGDYKIVLPHLSSYFFRRYLLTTLRQFTADTGEKLDFWTNLESAGNTGAASIYIMLDEYLRTHQLADGDRIMLFIPESGQFNFVLISLTVVRQTEETA